MRSVTQRVLLVGALLFASCQVVSGLDGLGVHGSGGNGAGAAGGSAPCDCASRCGEFACDGVLQEACLARCAANLADPVACICNPATDGCLEPGGLAGCFVCDGSADCPGEATDCRGP